MQLSDDKKADTERALKSYRKGDKVRAQIVSIDAEGNKISFGIKPSYFGEEDFAVSGMDVDEIDDIDSDEHHGAGVTEIDDEDEDEDMGSEDVALEHEDLEVDDEEEEDSEDEVREVLGVD